jgi:hypothetical protein
MPQKIMSRFKCFDEEAFSSFGISSSCQQKADCIAVTAYGSIQILPLFRELHISLVNTPRVIGGVEMRSTALIQFWSIIMSQFLHK